MLLLITIAVLGGMVVSLVEKLIKHRQEVLALKLEHERLKGNQSAMDFQALQSEVRDLKIRLDEQTILVDDLMRSFPRPDAHVAQRLGGQ